MNTAITKHAWGRKVLAIALAAVMVFGLQQAARPMTAYAGAAHNAGDAAALTDAINNVDNGGTITLTADFTYTSTISISSKSFTLNLNGHTLTINAAGMGIDINGNYTLTIQDSGTLGTLNVTGASYGIRARNGGVFAVTGGAIVTATGGSNGKGAIASGDGSTVEVTGGATGGNYGAQAESGGSVTVGGDATATSSSSTGAQAEGGGSVTVGGSATGTGCGARATGDGSTVNVTGNATATDSGSSGAVAASGGSVTVGGDATGFNEGAFADDTGSTVTVIGDVTGSDTGARAMWGGTIIIDGSITAPTYITIQTTPKNQDDGIVSSTMPGYLEYANNTSHVFVKDDGLFVPVTDITGVPTVATAGTPLALTGIVAPKNAANKTIVWTVQSAGTTGATIDGSTLNTAAAGTVTVTATITNGLTESSDYTQNFNITVSAGLRINGAGPYTTVATIRAAIVSALSSGDVTVTGAFATASDNLTLSIPTGKTVVWQAEYQGTASVLVDISGGGTLDVAEGGSLKSSGTDSTLYVRTNTAVKVSGGKVEATGTGSNASAIRVVAGAKAEVTGGEVKAVFVGILCSGDDVGAIVSVSGGTVSASGVNRFAIALFSAATVEISGIATITNTNGYAIYITNSAAVVSVKDGTVTGHNSVVYGTIHISGGTVSNPAGNALELSANGNAVISGGDITGQTGTPIVSNTANHGTAYYTGDYAGLFNTTRFTEGINLFKLDGAPALTANSIAYTYDNSTPTNYPVVAALSDKLDLTSATVTASAGFPTADKAANTVTFSTLLNKPAITITVTGAKVAGINVPVSFTTAAFGVNLDADQPDVSANISFAPGSATYTGAELSCAAAAISGITPGANQPWTYSYTASGDGTSLSANYKPLTAGTYTVTAIYEDEDNYYGEASGTFTVNKASQTAPATPTSSGKTETSVTLNTVAGYEYAYSEVSSAAGVSWQTSGSFTGLTPNRTYYFFARLAETANYHASPASAPLSFTTNQTAYVPVSITGTASKTIADKAYTGKLIKPVPVLTLKNVALKQGTDYIISSYKNNTNIGKATVTVTGKGKYAGTKTITFNIVPKKTSVSKVAAGKKQLKITWKKVSAVQKITKYEVRYKVKSAAKWQTKTVSAKSTNLTIKKLTKGKAYQVQVRSYKTVNKVNYYSAWSKIKTSGKVK
jgi:hypothetical protein